MSKCYICSGKGILKHLDRDICKKCFIRNVEKRVKKHLGRDLFKKNDSILVIGKLEQDLFKAVIGDLPLKITFGLKIPPNIDKFDFMVFGKTMDKIDEEFLSSLFVGELGLKGKQLKLEKGKEIRINENKWFNILEPLTEEEVKLYSKIKRIKIDIKKRDNSGVEFLDQLKEFKEIRYNIYKNIKELRSLVDK